MTGQHFKEILETVCMSTGTTKTKISNLLGVGQPTLCRWQNKGVPEAIKPYVMSVLLSVMLSNKRMMRVE